jgi:cobaltochelatase CobT
MAGPFPDRTYDAVGACTRALARSRDAAQPLAASTAATLSGLRAAGDRLAIRARFHDPATHHRQLPQDADAADLFNALEQARLDALGVRWMRGIAINLLHHPGAAEDGVRWLAFELLSGRAAPAEKSALVSAVRRRLPARVAEPLAALASLTADQGRFAAAAAAWAHAAAAYVPRAAAGAPATSPFPLPTRNVEVRERRKRGDAGATSAPLKRQAAQHDAGDSSSSTDGVAKAAVAGGGGYRAYTTAHDRVVNAAAVASREELRELRAKLEAELDALRPVVARVAKRLLRVLMARQLREWRFDQEEGLLDGSRLAPLVASRGGARPFKRELESRFPSTVVTLLIDHSGSMRGRPMQIAALTVELFVRVLERCGVTCEVLGFTTREWDGGTPAQEWAANGYPESPGRLNALEHIIIKGADVPWRRARVALGLFLRDEMLKENIDGEALAWAHARLLARSERRRILVVVSDGTPMDEATFAANGFDYLDRHLADVVEQIERRSPVQLAAIGIGHDVSHVYHNATKIARIDELGPALSAKLMALLAST